MYVVSAMAVTTAGLVYGHLATRSRRDVMAVSSALFFAAAFLVWMAARIRVGLTVLVDGRVVVEVMGALALVQFWTLANDLFNAREAKRLYGFIGAEGTVSNIVIGLMAARFATAYGTPSLLLLCAGLLVVTAGASFVGGFLGRQRLFARAATGK